MSNLIYTCDGRLEHFNSHIEDKKEHFTSNMGDSKVIEGFHPTSTVYYTRSSYTFSQGTHNDICINTTSTHYNNEIPTGKVAHWKECYPLDRIGEVITNIAMPPKVAIRGANSHKYCSTVGEVMNCRDTSISSQNIIRPQYLGKSHIALQGGDGNYCSDTDHGVVCNSARLGKNERFKVDKYVDISTGKHVWLLKGGRDKKYCRELNNGNMTCDGVDQSTWMDHYVEYVK